MRVPEPVPGRFNLRWRMFGADFRIHPLFWVSCMLVGVIYYQDPAIRGVPAFCGWMGAVLGSMLLHECGHVLVARLFGAQPRVVLSGLGGRVFGTEDLKRWQRLLVDVAGPLMNLALFGILWAITSQPPPADLLGPRGLAFAIQALWLLMWINALWALLNLLPLWPLDGGQIAVEIGEALLGTRGETLALVLSLLTSALLTAWAVLWMRVSLTNPFDPHYPLYLGYFCILALYCYIFWLSAFRALWGDTPPSSEKPADPGRAA